WFLSLSPLDIIAQRLSPGQHRTGIRSLVGGGEPIRLPDPSSALPPADSFPEAIPKYVSGRTSYLRAGLAFHPYPQVIRAVFNPQRFGPPPPVTAASTCSRVDRHGFGSTANYLVALFRLAFALPPALKALSCTGPVTRCVIMQKARRQRTTSRSPPPPPTACRHTFSGSVSLATWRTFHLSLTVLVRYR